MGIDNEEASVVPDLQQCQHTNTMNLYCSWTSCFEKVALFIFLSISYKEKTCTAGKGNER